MAKPELGDQEQYDGWPIKITQSDNYGRKPKAFLPEITITGLENPVVQIIDEKTNEIIYSLRLNASNFKAKVFDENTKYTIRVGEPDTKVWKLKKSISPYSGNLKFEF